MAYFGVIFKKGLLDFYVIMAIQYRSWERAVTIISTTNRVYLAIYS